MREVKRRPEAIWDVVDGVLTICNTSSSEIFELNDTGQFIWEGCQGRTPEAIALSLEHRYPEVPPAELQAHLSKYLSALVEAGLVDLIDGNRPGRAP